MTHRFKAVLFISALTAGSVQPASAAFVKHKIEVTAATGISSVAAVEVAFAPAPLEVRRVAQADKKKHGLLRRIGTWYMKKMAGDNQVVALILSIFLGGFGIDRFYLGYTGIGVLKLLTGGVFGILYLIDIVRIATGDLGPKGGSYTETL